LASPSPVAGPDSRRATPDAAGFFFKRDVFASTRFVINGQNGKKFACGPMKLRLVQIYES
jgi:hypothetical protein